MKSRQYKNIVAFKFDDEVIGFHRDNIELAELDQETWEALGSDNSSPANLEVRKELSEWSQQIDEEAFDLPASARTSQLSINIAQICNLSCTYCAAGGDGTYGGGPAKVDVTKATDQVKFFIDRLQPGQDFGIRFLGGEPLLYPSAIRDIYNFTKLYTAGRDIDVFYSITTNGTLITPKVAELLAEMNTQVTISIDGGEEINDQVRPAKKGGCSSTTLTRSGLKELLNVRDRLRGFTTNSVFGKHNLDIEGAYEFLKTFKPDSMNLIFATEPGDEEASRAYVKKMEQLAERLYSEGGLEALCQVRQFLEPLRNIASQARTINQCGSGKIMLQTDTSGRLYTCHWDMNDVNEAVGSGTEINHVKLDSWKPSLEKPGNSCVTCWAKYMCGGECGYMNKAKNSDKYEKDVEFCNRTRDLIALSIKYYSKSLKSELN